MLVRMGRIDEAVELLEATSEWCEERGLYCFGEWADTWLAAALLARGDPPKVPIHLLEAAAEGMRAAERILELPAALVLLAEARWRAGDAGGHDTAAEGARAAALEMGTFGPLLTVLKDHPEVPARCIEAGGATAEKWRALAASTGPPPEGSDLEGVRILLGTLGRPRVMIDGVEHEIAPLRALEVAASVARAGTEGVSRVALAEQVMDDSVNASNYLRQLVHRLRRLAPEGVNLISEGNTLRWSPRGAVIAEDQLLTSLLARARRELGRQRRRTLAAAIEVAARGPLVTSAHSPGGRRRREELLAAASEAHREYAELLLDAGRADEALAVARVLVDEQPYREDGSRLLMRATAVTSGASAVVPIYVECVRSLEAIGLTPSRETCELLDRLRESVASAAGRRA